MSTKPKLTPSGWLAVYGWNPECECCSAPMWLARGEFRHGWVAQRLPYRGGVE